MRIGLLQCGEIPDPLRKTHGDYPQLYAQLLGPGFDWRIFRVFEGDAPDNPNLCDGWLISGSRFGAYEDHPWIAPLEGLVNRIQNRKRMIGVCFGHQIIAQALGGRVEKFHGGWAVGRRPYEWDGRIVHLNAWHQDQVVVPPPGADTIISNDFTVHAGFRIGPKTLTVQAHPEFSTSYIADMVAHVGRGRVPDTLLDAAAEDLCEPVDNGAVGRLLAAFLRETE